MTREKLNLRSHLAGIVVLLFLSACGVETKVVPDSLSSSKQIHKLYKQKAKLTKPKTLVKQPVLLLRDSPRVRVAINYFSGTGKSYIEDGLTRKQEYASMIENEFKALDLPDELSNIALLESRYLPRARSPSGAVGMWQFMAPTARSLGLRVGYFTDERKDPEKSTRAAAQYLKNLYQEHGDWFLAIAAYNAGSGNVNKAIKRCGTKDFFEFEKCSGLRNETLDFVSRFVALTAITRRQKYYGD